MARFSDLSQELIDLVIDHFKQDRKSLLACSLVAKACFARSHYHLLKKVALKGNSKTIRRFVSSGRRVAPVVKELRLFSADPTALDASVFAELLKALPVLRSVVLSEVRIRRFDDEKQHWDVASLDYLELSYENIPPRNLVRLLASFSHTPIKTLILDCCCSEGAHKVAHLYDLVGFAPQGQWRIDDLHLTGTIRTELILKLLWRMVDPAGLRRLTLGAGVGGDNDDRVKTFMEKFGPGLRTLQLQVTTMWTPPELYGPILSNCTSLKSLSVLLLCYRPASRSRASNDRAASLTYSTDNFTLSTFMGFVLPHIPRNVPHITLSFARDPAPEFKTKSDPSNSGILERFLAQDPPDLARSEQHLLRLDALERVDVVLGSGARVEVPEHLREKMVKTFSVLHDTGKLQFPGRSETEVAWLVRPDALDNERGV